MTFLQPIFLIALPLAVLPVIIHLIHLHRRRSVKWAAMMFLLAAQRMNKGFSRLRQILILALRVLSVLAIILVVCRPLAGGLLGLLGGAPDTVIVLLDRSASMEQQNLAEGLSKRKAGLEKLSSALKQSYGSRTRIALIDSASAEPQAIERARSLVDLPLTEATDTGADIPAMLQAALDFMTLNKTGRTDVWLVSDLRQSDWDAGSGRWASLRGAFAALKAVRFHVLTYAGQPKENLAISVERVMRRESGGKAELLLDIRVAAQPPGVGDKEVPVRLVVNGAVSVHQGRMKDGQLVLQGYAVPIDRNAKRGWGRVELPADDCPADNAFHFVFDEPPVLASVIVSDDAAEIEALKAALQAPAEPARKYAVAVVPTSRAAEIAWDEMALVVWHAAIPEPGDVIAKQLRAHVMAGRAVIFLPAEPVTDAAIFGLRWGQWRTVADGEGAKPEWWRNDAGLLANTRNGAALPVGELEIRRHCEIIGDGIPLARLPGNQTLLVRSSGEDAGGAYFLATLPGSGTSSLARDGVVFFAMLHRALAEGGRTIGKAQMRDAGKGALAGGREWKRVSAGGGDSSVPGSWLPLQAGVVESGDQLVALNRPLAEDSQLALSSSALHELFDGLDYRRIDDTLDSRKKLTSEIWRTILVLMAIALITEALLCMPERKQTAASPAVLTG